MFRRVMQLPSRPEVVALPGGLLWRAGKRSFGGIQVSM